MKRIVDLKRLADAARDLWSNRHTSDSELITPEDPREKELYNTVKSVEAHYADGRLPGKLWDAWVDLLTAYKDDDANNYYRSARELSESAERLILVTHGPQPDGRFRYGDITVERLSKTENRLLRSIWERCTWDSGGVTGRAMISQVVLDVWADEEKEATALKPALWKLGRKLLNENCTLSLSQDAGFIVIELT